METLHPITADLTQWYRQHARDLPWRRQPEPYATWLSEVILQQTRVDTGTAYWHRFLAAYPTVQDLAEAPIESVMSLWQGLGYYSRARNLHKAAQQIVETGKGQLPDHAAAWQALPGVGEYTAAAISSICFNEPVPVIDGNVQRVLSRLFDVPDRVDRKAGKAAIRAAAESLVDPGDPGTSNQAWMELGALVCTPKSPRCEDCPLRGACAARAAGTQLDRPVKAPKKKATEVQALFRVHVKAGAAGGPEWWVERRPESGIWGGLEAFPVALEPAPGPTLPEGAWGPVRHILTHRHITAWFHFLPAASEHPKGAGQWVSVDAGTTTFPRLIDKVLPDLRQAVKNWTLFTL